MSLILAGVLLVAGVLLEVVARRAGNERFKTIVRLAGSFAFFGFAAFYFYDGGADAFLQRVDKCFHANGARCLLEAAIFNFQVLMLAAALLVIVIQAFVLFRRLGRDGGNAR